MLLIFFSQSASSYPAICNQDNDCYSVHHFVFFIFYQAMEIGKERMVQGRNAEQELDSYQR